MLAEYLSWKRKNDVVATIMHIASQTNIEQFDNLEVTTRKDGLKVINIPAPELKGIITEYQIEKEGLNWKDTSGELIQHGWAKRISATEILLTVDLVQNKEQISRAFNTDFLIILPILQQVIKGKTQEEQQLQKNLINWWDLVNDWNGIIK